MANGEQPLFGRRFTIISAVIVVLGLIYLVLRSDPELRPKLYPPEPVASGLTNPRALAFGADGLLYVAEAGYGGRTSGQVSRITADGQPEVIAMGLPSNPERGRLRPAGPSSLWPLDSALLVATGSADDALLRVRRQQPSVPATDLRSALAKVGLTGTLAPLGLVGDGTHVVVLEAASATLVRLDLREPGNPQPTVVGRLPAGVNALNMAPSADGGWLVVDFGPIPYVQGSGSVWHVSPTGQVERVVEGLDDARGRDDRRRRRALRRGVLRLLQPAHRPLYARHRSRHFGQGRGRPADAERLGLSDGDCARCRQQSLLYDARSVRRAGERGDLADSGAHRLHHRHALNPARE